MKIANLTVAVADIVNIIVTSGLPGMRPNDLKRLSEVSKSIEPAGFLQDLTMRFHTEPNGFTSTLHVRFEFTGDEFTCKCEFSWVTSTFDLVTGMEVTSLQLGVLNLGARIENKYRL